MNAGNGVELTESIRALGVITTRQASTAVALHESIVTVRPYAISMRWTPILLALSVLIGLVNTGLLFLMLQALLRR